MRRSADRVARHVAGMQLSAIKEMAMRAARRPGTVSLAWGLPSFATPAPIRRAVAQALESDPQIGMYALPDGLRELREAVAARHLELTGRAVDPDANVLITAGNMQGVNALLHALIDPGDEVIVTDPGFASHMQQIALCGGRTVFAALDAASGWGLDPAAIAAAITPRTKAVILVTPSNPTGAIFGEAELRAVGELARTHGLLVVLDDPYCHFTYENRARYFNLASVEAFADHVAYLFTFSKSYAMSGWRLGYMVVPAWLKAEALKVHDATLICTPRIAQVAGIAGLAGDKAHLAAFEATLGARRRRICERLDRLAHVFSYAVPEGAYYVFPRILVPHEDSRSFAVELLEKVGVSVTPGGAFGPSGEHHVRMAFCVDEATIDAAFDRIEAAWPI